MINVLLVDDQPLIRAGLLGILAAHEDISAVEVGDGISALRHLARFPVDVILMDIRMPGMDGVEATRRVREQAGRERPRILVLTTFENDETVVEALSAGADGFLSKGIEPDDLVDAIRALDAGRSPMSEGATDALIRHVAVRRRQRKKDPAMESRFAALTVREREIVIAIAQGRTHEEIADDEHISRYTVKTHINRAMMKVSAADRAQLVAFAHRAGLVYD